MCLKQGWSKSGEVGSGEGIKDKFHLFAFCLRLTQPQKFKNANNKKYVSQGKPPL